MEMSANRQALLGTVRLWGIRLCVGILFLILGFVVLGYDTQSITVVSILIGVAFLFTGLSWLLLGMLVEEMRWWFIVGGLLAVIAGIIAFIHPDSTLRVLGLIIGWFLLIAGILDVIVALTNRDRDLWWIGLIAGLVMFGLGAWAVNSQEHSIAIILTIVGVYCLIRGVGDIIASFQMRKMKKELLAS